MTKICIKCGVEYALSMYEKRSSNTYRNDCIPCRKQWQREYYQKNREAKLRYAKDRREANPEYRKEYYRRTQDERLQYQKEYYEKNKDEVLSRMAEYSAERRVTDKLAKPSWLSEEDMESIKAIYAASRALTEETGIQHHVDHIVPLRGENVCGLHVHWNMRVIPAEDNWSKNNKHNDWG